MLKKDKAGGLGRGGSGKKSEQLLHIHSSVLEKQKLLWLCSHILKYSTIAFENLLTLHVSLFLSQLDQIPHCTALCGAMMILRAVWSLLC